MMRRKRFIFAGEKRLRSHSVVAACSLVVGVRRGGAWNAVVSAQSANVIRRAICVQLCGSVRSSRAGLHYCCGLLCGRTDGVVADTFQQRRGGWSAKRRTTSCTVQAAAQASAASLRAEMLNRGFSRYPGCVAEASQGIAYLCSRLLARVFSSPSSRSLPLASWALWLLWLRWTLSCYCAPPGGGSRHATNELPGPRRRP